MAHEQGGHVRVADWHTVLQGGRYDWYSCTSHRSRPAKRYASALLLVTPAAKHVAYNGKRVAAMYSAAVYFRAMHPLQICFQKQTLPTARQSSRPVMALHPKGAATHPEALPAKSCSAMLHQQNTVHDMLHLLYTLHVLCYMTCCMCFATRDAA